MIYGERAMLSSTATISCREVECVVRGSRVFMRRGWDCKEVFVCDHLRANACAELLNLLSDVSQERVAAPSSNEHNCEDRNPCEIH